MKIIIWILTGLLLVGFCFQTDIASEEKKLSMPVVTLTGADSKIETSEYLQIESLNDWIHVWQRHKGVPKTDGYDLFYDPLAMPSIDFERYVVIAIFSGHVFNRAGLTAESISETDVAVTLRFRSKSYQTIGGGVDAHAFGFFVLPKTKKQVVVEEGVVAMINQPVKWVERHRFEK